MLLTNDLTDICREISTIQLVLWMDYTFIVKGLEEVEKMGKKWIYFASLTKIIRDEGLKQTIPVSLKPFIGR